MMFEVFMANTAVLLYSSGFKIVGRRFRPRVPARAPDRLCLSICYTLQGNILYGI